MKEYTDIFIDFDDTLYDTHGNSVIALRELFDEMNFAQWFDDPEVFYTAYWNANIDLWTRYSKGEITRDYLIVERFRRPLSASGKLEPTKEYCLEVSDRFLELCSSKPGVVEGAHELMEYLKGKGYRIHMCSNGNKPAKEFFEYAFKVTGAKPETTLMIGDNFQTDIMGAMRAGIDAVFFNRYPEYTAPEEGQKVVTSLEELRLIV